MKANVYRILLEGSKEELHTDGKCIHDYPAHETTNFLNYYFKLKPEDRTEIDEKVALNMAALWVKYFKFGRELYTELRKKELLTSKKVDCY